MPSATAPVSASVAIIGGGPAGLMAAETLARAGVQVDLFDAMPSVGRKFLLAGRGGLNITHSEAFAAFAGRYGSRRAQIEPLLAAFTPQALREWVEALGVTTFVGTSGRVFPAEMKAAPLLRAWLQRLREAGVRFHVRHRWIGWHEDGRLTFTTPDGPRHYMANATVLALGGGSWLGRAGQGVTPDQAEALLTETLAILDDPALAPLFGAGSRAEVPVTGVIATHVISGQVDRLSKMIPMNPANPVTLAQAILVVGEPGRGVLLERAGLVEFGVDAGADEPALAEVRWRGLDAGVGDGLCKRGKGLSVLGERCQERGEGRDAGECLFERERRGEGLAEGDQVSRRGSGHCWWRYRCYS